jgi:hypothetical protein
MNPAGASPRRVLIDKPMSITSSSRRDAREQWLGTKLLGSRLLEISGRIEF